MTSIHCWLLTDLEAEARSMVEKVQAAISALQSVLGQRRELETEMQQCHEWLDQAAVSLASEIRRPSVEILDEQYTHVSDQMENSDQRCSW
jgi:hypothetical protein